MCGVLLAIAIIIIAILTVGIYQKSTNAICLSRRRLEGKTVIVTGGTAGMGLEIAKDMAHRGARVIIACPFQDEGTGARRQIVEETENNNVIFKLLELSSLKSIRNFTADILKTEDRLDILINNAGVGFPKKSVKSDGMHFIMQVNYCGAFLLTLLLLPLLKKTGKIGEPSRILTTSSTFHFIGRVDYNNLNKTSYNCPVLAYANSKFCLVSFSRELAKKLQGSNVVINIVDPGAVGTRIFDSLSFGVGILVTIVFYVLYKTPWQGAQTALHVALDKKAGFVSGQYFRNCKIQRFFRQPDDISMKKLWDQSMKLVQLTDYELQQCLK